MTRQVMTRKRTVAPRSPSIASPVAVPPRSPFSVASDLTEVIAAWKLVYQVYINERFIDPNPERIHFTPPAVSPRSAVVSSSATGEVDCTATSMLDSSRYGLPLDSVYRGALDALRAEGRTLVEIGMLADRLSLPNAVRPATGVALDRSQYRILGRIDGRVATVMAMSMAYAIDQKATDVVIGVHPTHARFYGAAFGFEPEAAPTTYASVNHKPVVLLRLNLQRLETAGVLPDGVRYAVNLLKDEHLFTHRCSFDISERPCPCPRLDRYLRHLTTDRPAVELPNEMAA